MNSIQRSSLLGVLGVSLLLAPIARAEGPTDMVERGVALRRERHDAEALELFRKAYAQAPSPRLLAQIGLAENALARWVDAEAHLVEALRATSDPWIAEHLDGLAGVVAELQTRLARLEITSNVEAAELFVNGEHVGAIPRSDAVRIVAGHVVVELRAPKGAVVQRELDVQGDAHSRLFVAFPVLPAAPVGTVSSAGDAATAPAPSTAKTLGIVSLTGGGALLLGATALTLYRNDQASRFNALCPYGALSSDPRCGDLRQRADTAQTLSIVGYAAGGVASILGAALLWSARSATPRSTALGCVVPGFPAVVCSGAF